MLNYQVDEMNKCYCSECRGYTKLKSYTTKLVDVGDTVISSEFGIVLMCGVCGKELARLAADKKHNLSISGLFKGMLSKTINFFDMFRW